MSSAADDLEIHSRNPEVACTVCGQYVCSSEDSRCRHQLHANRGEIEAAYREFHAPLLAYARRCCRKVGVSNADIDDESVVQDAFLAALPHWDELREPRAYLFAVVRKLVSHGIRSSSHRWSYALEDARNELNVWWTSAVLQPPAEKFMAARRVFEVLAGLPERQRVATYLSHIDGMSHAEIAELLGCAPATVGVHVHRGVEKLRDDPHTVAAPRDLTDAKPKADDPLARLGWRARRAIRRFGRGLAYRVLWLPRQSVAVLTLARQWGGSARRALYPSTAVASFDAAQQAFGVQLREGFPWQVMLCLLRANLVALAPRWIAETPPVPPCTTCTVGWLRDDGTYGCWCRRYHASATLARRLRIRQKLRRRAVLRRTTQQTAASTSPLATHVSAALASLPRHQRWPYTVAVVVLVVRRQFVRLSMQVRQRRMPREEWPTCVHCGAYRPRADGSIGCWCGSYSASSKPLPRRQRRP